MKEYKVEVKIGVADPIDISGDVKNLPEVIIMQRNRDFSPVIADIKLTVANYDPLLYPYKAKILISEEGVVRYIGFVDIAYPNNRTKLYQIDVKNIFSFYKEHLVGELYNNYDPASIDLAVSSYKNETDRVNFITVNRIEIEGVIKAIFESDFEDCGFTCDIDFSNYVMDNGNTLSDFYMDRNGINYLGVEEFDEDYVFVPSEMSIWDFLDNLCIKIGFTFEIIDDTVKITKYDNPIDEDGYNSETNEIFPDKAINSFKPRTVRKDLQVKSVRVDENYPVSPLVFYGGIYLNIINIRTSTANDRVLSTGNLGYANGVYIEFDQLHYLQFVTSRPEIRIKGTQNYDDSTYFKSDNKETGTFYPTSTTAIVLCIPKVSNVYASPSYVIPILAPSINLNYMIFGQGLPARENGLTHSFLQNLVIFRYNLGQPQNYLNYNAQYEYGYHLTKAHEWNALLYQETITVDNTEDLTFASVMKRGFSLRLKRREYNIMQEKLIKE